MSHPTFDATGGATAAPLAGRTPLTGIVSTPAVGAVRAQDAALSAAPYLSRLTALVNEHLMGDATYSGADMEALLLDARKLVTNMVRLVESANDRDA